jgi:hypothetical protein
LTNPKPKAAGINLHKPCNPNAVTNVGIGEYEPNCGCKNVGNTCPIFVPRLEIEEAERKMQMKMISVFM